MIFDNADSVALDKNSIQAAIDGGMTSDQIINTSLSLTKAEDFLGEVRRNAAFRVSYNTASNGSLLTLTKLPNGDYKFNNFPDYGTQSCNEAFLETHPGSKVSDVCKSTGMNTKELAECMECIHENNLHYLCSRDNFAIRPKAVKVSLADDNTSTVRADFANNTDKYNNINLIAGYPYRFDINATTYTDEGPAKGYVQRFDSTDPSKRAYMKWSPSAGKDVSGCNAPDDRNMSFYLVNGTDTNLNPLNTWDDRHDTLNNVGEYQFRVDDEEWTKYDWETNLTSHHSGSHFASGPDCTRGSVSSPATGEVGCTTSSVDGASYHPIMIRSYPAHYDVSGLQRGARPSNDTNDTFVYMNTMDISTYPNAMDDENMSFNIQGFFRAVSDENKTLSNFVKNCYADDTDMILYYEPLTADENISGLQYDLYDYNISGFSRVDSPLPSNAVVSQAKENFVKALKGGITMDLGYNYDRRYNVPINPKYIRFKEMNITDAGKPAKLYAHGSDEYNITGSYTIDQNVTFIYGRAKSSRYIYDDVSASSIKTPISLVAYCDLGLSECLKRGLDDIATGMLKDARSEESFWWVVQKHNTDSGDGQVTLRSSTNGTVSPAAPTPLSLREGIDKNVTVTHTGANLPDVVDIDFGNTTDRWLIYNVSGDNVPSPFYRIRFIGGNGWVGYGKGTGHVMEGTVSNRENPHVEW